MKGKVISQQILSEDGEIITVYTDAAPIELLPALDQDSLQHADPADEKEKEKDKHEEPHTLQADRRSHIPWTGIIGTAIGLIIVTVIAVSPATHGVPVPLPDPAAFDTTALLNIASKIFNGLLPIIVVLGGLMAGMGVFYMLARLIRNLFDL